ncbi:MAG: lysophospholipid acyltransferase family protein [Desulforhopalus sp.]
MKRWLKRDLLNRLEHLGHWFFYVALKLFGQRGGYALLVPVIFIYVLCRRSIHRVTRSYLTNRFPGDGAVQNWLHTFKNIFSFGQVLVDRGWLGVKKKATIEGWVDGYDTLIELIHRRQGVVLLTAHVGNWQSALAHLGGLPVKVNALMQYDQQAAAKHFFDLQGGQRSFEIIDADGQFGGMVDAVAALGRGEIVTIMGDRYVRGTSSVVDFFGNSVRVPDGAYMLAASAKAPVVILLAAKTGRKTYQLKMWDHFYPEFQSRDERSGMLQECSTRFIRAVEEYLKIYPYQWYNFYDFWKQ